MAELLKHSINQKFLDQLADALEKDVATFNRKKFEAHVSQKILNSLELKGRWGVVAIALFESLPKNYPESLKELQKIAPQFSGLPAFCFPTFVELFAPSDHLYLEDSLFALGLFTQFSTAEFAIRHLYKINPKKVLEQMINWSTHSNFHLRRLSSEGLRPRLPWGIKIPDFIQDPQINFQILEKLKNDPELYVRKSVANHLNDIGKDHPKLLIETCKRWWGISPHTNWIIKHALRNMLKTQNPEALKIVGIKNISIKAKLKLHKKKIKLYNPLNYSVDIKIAKKSLIRIDIILYFIRQTFGEGKKVFKIYEKETSKDLTLIKKLSLKKMTTRKYFKGKHRLELVVNGKIYDEQTFVVF